MIPLRMAGMKRASMLPPTIQFDGDGVDRSREDDLLDDIVSVLGGGEGMGSL
jgi:hypothetical protein